MACERCGQEFCLCDDELKVEQENKDLRKIVNDLTNALEWMLPKYRAHFNECEDVNCECESRVKNAIKALNEAKKFKHNPIEICLRTNTTSISLKDSFTQEPIYPDAKYLEVYKPGFDYFEVWSYDSVKEHLPEIFEQDQVEHYLKMFDE